ncbi:MAG TPA: hypothetical protein VFU06_06580 [Longimicrobiales bacterium]|nr:hypothetical protein [Longimicrobiales bacterium]
MFWKRSLGSGVLLCLAITACTRDSNPVALDAVMAAEGVQDGYIQVYKVGPEGTYNFTASESVPGALWATDFSVNAGAWKQIGSLDDPLAAPSDITVSELEQAGIQVDSIVMWRYTNGGLTSRTVHTGTNSVTAYGMTNINDVIFKFFNSQAPVSGSEGCTPGYWKQPHHFVNWVGYSPSDSFAAVFGVSYPGSLLDALSAGGGGVKALNRHAVAALLNASGSVGYPASVADVIAAVNAAYGSGDYESQKNVFEAWNEAGCPL